ncbi:replicative DNA helicase [Planotetraspora sp. A-T 1434]|uniref:replicative DNA helicase n=1 Tax=Planotetraspora sp. A-T 1434 TaxID=2979219 RepID=UPI0021C002DD|nr:replicative DNA helicase [Planotetraspora sp. A-T 1434]MCT9932419.1 replicative DNA helicase [Planotetraspora sp. A-T 1434]
MTNLELPHDLEAEMACLGAAMLSSDSAALVVEKLTPRHFYRPAHQVVFEAIAELLNQSKVVEPLSVKAQLEHRRSQEREVVDPATLLEMVESVISANHITVYLDRLEDLRYRRALILEGGALTRLGYRTDLERDDVAAQAYQVLERAAGVPQHTSGRSLAELVYPYLDRLEDKTPQPGVTTGWHDLDALLVKVRPGQFIVIGARPGMGKSVLMVNMALHVGLKLNQPVLFCTLEMSEDELLDRIFANRAKVNLHALLNKRLDEDAWERVGKRAAEMAAAEHFVIDDDTEMTVAKLRGKLSAMRRAGRPPAVVFVDYLQLMSTSQKVESRQQEISTYSRQLKLLAKEFEVPIVAGCQLNRESEKRVSKRPTKADLRESGAIEQDADVVILLHREDVYEPDSPRRGEIDLIVDKHRQGPTATITAAFQGHYARISDMAADEPSSAR